LTGIMGGGPWGQEVGIPLFDMYNEQEREIRMMWHCRRSPDGDPKNDQRTAPILSWGSQAMDWADRKGNDQMKKC